MYFTIKQYKEDIPYSNKNKQAIHTQGRLPSAPMHRPFRRRLSLTSGSRPSTPRTARYRNGSGTDAQSLENIKAILEAAGSGMDKVVKTTVF